MSDEARRDRPTPERLRPSDSARDRVLRAAQALFSERGFRGTSVRAVAQQAAVSVGCVQHHFGTKAALERAVMERAEAVFLERQTSAFATDDADFAGLLREGMRNYFAWARDHPEVMRLGAWLILEGRDPRWPGEARQDAELVRRLMAARGAGEIREVDPLLLLTVVGMLMNGWAVFQAQHGLRLGDGGDALDARFVEFVVDLLGNGLRPR
ncbi:MAG: TetR/AcrR family transcriptional regulator [Myxococcota bacterium]